VGRAEETRQSIIEKAAVVFNRNGYQRTSMSMLTEALGLTKGAIYGHFQDKDALAVEAFRHIWQRRSEAIRAIVVRHERPLDRLRAFAGAFVEFYEETVQDGGCPVLNTATDADDAHPRLHREVRRALAEWERALLAIVEAGKDCGELRRDADGKLFASTFIALIEGGLLLAKTVGDRTYLERAIAGIGMFIEHMRVDDG